jgi:hypothetical protein
MGTPVARSGFIEPERGFRALNGRNERAMTWLRVAIGVMWVLCFLMGRTAMDVSRPSPIAATSAEITDWTVPTIGAVAGGSLVEPDDSNGVREPLRDLFGNEIEEAIADYRIDLRGGVYERHAPDTAVPKLGSPTT